MTFFPVNTMFNMLDVMRTRFFQGLETELNQIRQTAPETFKSKQTSYREHRHRDGTVISESTQTTIANGVTVTITVQRVGEKELKIVNTLKHGESPISERFIKNMTTEMVPQFLTDFAKDPYEQPHPEPDGWMRLE